jgi:hypothetical protein
MPPYIARPLAPSLARPLVSALGGGRQPWDAEAGDAPAQIPISLLTFTRSSEASYLTSAPTSGAAAFLAWAAADALRMEDRGDGAGPLALIERSTTNHLLYSRSMTNLAWSPATYTRTANAGNGPDGTAVATRVQGSALALDQIVLGLGGVVMCGSVWLRRYDGTTGSGQMLIYNPVAANGSTSLAATYARFASRATGADKLRAVDSADRSGSGGIAAYTADLLADLAQLEPGYYPTSVIRTTTAAVVRSADTATLASALVPPSMLARRWSIQQVSPVFATADLISGDVRVLMSLGDANNCVRIRHTGTDVRCEAVQGGVVKASSGALSFARHALLGPVTWDPATAIVSVGGVAGSAGTPWTWAAADLRVGGIYGGAGEADCRLGGLVRA